MTIRALALFLAISGVLSLGGCGGEATAPPPGSPPEEDAGEGPGEDAGESDAKPSDAGAKDAAKDSGTGNDGGKDAGAEDKGIPDTAEEDTAAPDTGRPDADVPDTGPADTAPPDNAPADVGPPDTGTPDTAPADTGPADTGSQDTGATTPGKGVPRVTIELPRPRSFIKRGAELDFRGTAEDDEDGIITENFRYRWSSSVDGPIGIGRVLQKGTLATVGRHTITLTVEDSAGNKGSASVDVTVSDKVPPVVNIIKPADGSFVKAGDEVKFEADVTDPEDPTAGSGAFGYEWISSLGDQLPVGNGVIGRLTSIGVHTITLTVTNSRDKRQGSGFISLEVGTDYPPDVYITAPKENARFYSGEEAALEGLVKDAEDGDNPANYTYVWSSDKEGELGKQRVLKAPLKTVGVQTLTFSVTDAANRKRSKSIKVEVLNNTAPTAKILKPKDGSRVNQGEPVFFEGEASDPEEGPLSGGALKWISDKAGELGRGATVSVANLPAGVNNISFEATDRGKLSARARVAVVINGAPVVKIVNPAEPKKEITEGQNVALSGTVSDDVDQGLKGSWFTSTAEAPIKAGDNNASYNNVPAGKHRILFEAVDKENAVGRAYLDVIAKKATGQLYETYSGLLQSASYRDHASWTNGQILLATDQGLFEFNPNNSKFFLSQFSNSDPKSINSNNVLAIDAVVKSGPLAGPSLFVAGTSQGAWVCKVAGDGTSDCARISQGAGSLPNNEVRAVRARGDEFLAGTPDGLALINGAQQKVTKTWTKAQGLISNTVTSLALDPQNNAWIGTDAGLCKLTFAGAGQPEKFDCFSSTSTSNGLPSDKINAVAHANNTVWVATDEGLTRYDPAAANNKWMTFTKDLHGLPSDKIRYLESGPEKEVWAATPFGAARVMFVNGRLHMTVFNRDDLANENIFMIRAVSATTKWFGTDKGLIRYNGK
ncbi:MAG: hypothetical protein GMKNLPBB_02360 [Myxococcota bacterium]|nr:hypothetical protein [Myxococcota bacterium]